MAAGRAGSRTVIPSHANTDAVRSVSRMSFVEKMSKAKQSTKATTRVQKSSHLHYTEVTFPSLLNQSSNLRSATQSSAPSPKHRPLSSSAIAQPQPQPQSENNADLFSSARAHE